MHTFGWFQGTASWWIWGPPNPLMGIITNDMNVLCKNCCENIMSRFCSITKADFPHRNLWINTTLNVIIIMPKPIWWLPILFCKCAKTAVQNGWSCKILWRYYGPFLGLSKITHCHISSIHENISWNNCNGISYCHVVIFIELF